MTKKIDLNEVMVKLARARKLHECATESGDAVSLQVADDAIAEYSNILAGLAEPLSREEIRRILQEEAQLGPLRTFVERTTDRIYMALLEKTV